MLRQQPGFSLIELMVAIVIMSILIVMGAPSFSAYLANTKVRSNAEALLAGLQLARADAVRRNAIVQFLLTNDPPIAASVGAAAPALTGANWMVRTADLTTFIEGKQGAESSNRAQGAASQVNISATAATVTFNGLGGATTATFDFTNPTGGACANAGPIRCLRIVVSPGGRIHMCDPAIVTAGDTRGC